MNYENPKRKDLSRREWFERAKEKIESFLPELDKNLRVEVQERRITLKSGEEYDALVLLFTHALQPDFKWTMDIDTSDAYIENELEGVVRKVYMEDAMGEATH